MATVYATVKMNTVYEVLNDQCGNSYLFKNGSYFKFCYGLDHAKFIIESLHGKR
jgi:hypothetical protein